MFCKHAHRVRDFHGQCLWITLVPSVNCIALSNDAREVVVAFLLRLGAEGQPRSLFPNLVKYTAPVSDKMFTLPRYTPFVCGDTLGSLDLSRENHTSDAYPPMDPDPYTTLFETLPIFGSRWFRLRMVRLFLPLPKEDEPRDRYLNMLDEFLAQLRELRTLEVYLALQESLINHLSELPQLRFMTLTLDCVVHRGPSPRLLPHGFRALQELHITTFVTEDLISLLQVLPCAGRLTKLVLILNLQSVKDSESQPTWFGRLLASASRAHTLRHLFIHIRSDYLAQERILSGELLSILTNLRRIQFLRLRGLADIHVDDSTLEAIGGSWPHLNVLFCDYCHVISFRPGRPSWSLLGVYRLCSVCPKLTTAKFIIKNVFPLSIDDLPTLPTRDNSMKRLTLLFHGPLEDREIEALMLLVRILFPKLESLTVEDWFTFEPHRKVWLRYKDILRLDVTTARQLLEQELEASQQ